MAIILSKTQVLIAGAGPTGLSMAAQLIRYNIDFVLLEKKEAITQLSKALVVQARTLEIFQELGIAEEALRRGQRTTALNLFYKGKRKVNIDLNGLGTGISEFTFALSLEQSKTEKLLAEYVISHNRSIHWNCEITRLEQENDLVKVHYKDPWGQEQLVNASYVVGCDGASSIIRHQLGLSFGGTTEPKLFYVADVLLNSSVINKDKLYMFMIKKGFVLFFPMEGSGHYRVIGILPEHQDENHEYSFSEVEPGIKESIEVPVEFAEVKWFSSYKVHSRKADEFMKGHCFIAGDAAHIHTPAGGQGMNTGIQDAYNLAWKLAGVIKRELKENVLKTYDTERSENAAHLLRTTDRMFDIMSGVKPFWNFIRLNFFSRFISIIPKIEFIRKRMFPLLSQTGIAYPQSELTVPGAIGKVKAGDRIHYFTFSNGKSIFSYLAEPSFKVLYFGNGEIKSNLFSEIRIPLNYHSFNEVPEIIFGNEKDFYILLRPDNHISYIGKNEKHCLEFLKQVAEIQQ